MHLCNLLFSSLESIPPVKFLSTGQVKANGKGVLLMLFLINILYLGNRSKKVSCPDEPAAAFRSSSNAFHLLFLYFNPEVTIMRKQQKERSVKVKVLLTLLKAASNDPQQINW